MDVVEDIYLNPTRELYVHMLHDLPTHPTLHLDSDFTLSSDTPESDLVVSFPFGTRNKIFDPGIFIEVQYERFLSPNEFSFSFIRDPLSSMFDTLLPFSSENEDNVFNPGILASNEEKSPHLLSHRGFKAFQLISESPMMISRGDIPILDDFPDCDDSRARDYPTWEVIQNGNGLVSITTDTQGQIKVLPPRTKGFKKANDRFQSLLSQLEIHGAVFENDVKGSTASSTNTQNIAFVSENTSSTNDVSTTYSVSNPSGQNSQEGVDWTSHSEEEEDYTLMACNSSGLDIEVSSCSKESKESYAKLKKLYDEQRAQLSDASIEIQAYTQGLKKVEA
ncbi:hypothetical protein Tco_0373441 [Tanacetum coccineum]